jgi:CarboxypepD_reg-like domain/TonB-dependent Receptor Plug Domain
MKKQLFLSFLLLLGVFSTTFAQKGGGIRGNVYDKASGQPLDFANVFLVGTTKGTITNSEGFFNLSDIAPGKYTLIANMIGYDSMLVNVTVVAGNIAYQRLEIRESGVQLGTVNISGKKQQAHTEVQVAKISVTPKEIKSLPATGGDADIAQYLPVIPGVVFTGDQGGQLYIRGGSPIQNKILLDGMTIYNPFHSIGFYSVFETEAIRSVDVLTGGFGAEYGGRVSAVVDIKTREGNKKRFSGLVASSPFQAKAMIEGPIIKLKEEGGGSLSFLFTGKQSLIDQTAQSLYKYAARDSSGLPFKFKDFYGKVSALTGNGSKFNVFGFDFDDGVKYKGIADYGWHSSGGGANFTLIPQLSNIIVAGKAYFSNYSSSIVQSDNKPRTSSINSYNVGLDFSYFGDNNEVKYGFEVNGFTTDFKYVNAYKITFQQEDNATEIGSYVKYRQKIGPLIIEPSVRFNYYASLGDFQVEPRFGAKLNLGDHLRFKFAGGYYTQNLISTVNERDVVSLFVGFLSSPGNDVLKPGSTTETVSSRLQKAVHAIAGFEVDVNDHWDLTLEPYYKRFTQLLGVNRNKTKINQPDFAAETGNAYGIDFSSKYQNNHFYLWTTYSYGFVNRNDGQQVYPTIFDRRHNVNVVSTYNFGKNDLWEAGVRWNLGSGFPFTLTQGFYNNQTFNDGMTTNFLTNNPDIGILYSDKRNSGRLPYYHRLDISVKRTINFSKYSRMELTASATNAYNRKNIFYFDRINYRRVDQLPILPTLSMAVFF